MFVNWTDEDIAFIKGAGITSEDAREYQRRPIFRCWQESWEIEVRKKRDPVNQAKLQTKYAGIRFYDLDDETYWQRHQGIEACQQECVGKVREKYEKSTRKVREYYVNICLSV